MQKLVTAIFAVVVGVAPVMADVGVCHSVDVSLEPQKRADLRPGRQQPPQIVAWIEDATGHFIATIFITQATGTYGIGNRPGRFDMNSAPQWPYGRRVGVFPVWAERKPERYDAIVYQDGIENALQGPFYESSADPHFCHPMESSGAEARAYDAMTCASRTIFTDKGHRDGTLVSKYPPRQDVVRTDGPDSVDVNTYPAMNRFDAISTATPATGQVTTFGWTMPSDLAVGNYVLWVEASTEFDHNATYSEAARPGPTDMAYPNYGEPYRGQPSVVYKVPFAVAASDSVARTTSYVGYGDPDGANGTLHAPDASITTDVLGSGVDRLALVADPDGDYRVKVASHVQIDAIAPSAPQQLALAHLASRAAVVDFIETGDDATSGTVRGYDIRYRVGTPVTIDNFDAPDSITVPSSITPVAAGEPQQIALEGLLPATHYYVGVRANDECGNASEIATVDFTTSDRAVDEVDACFIATAAYGSLMAGDVVTLRHVRDALLRRSVLGELAVEAYYTFSPPMAGVVGESDLLRWTARDVLYPIVRYVRSYTF
ncbi:MAG TPA: CFI-box-CTERM domain-containing protein [Kofleriaceae bacterium]|jgi:hypothetical protein